MPDKAYTSFENDIPEASREDVMQMMAEATGQYGEHDCVTILDRDRLDAVNCRASGIIEVSGVEYTFSMEDGNRNGTELLAWNDGAGLDHHIPTKWALAPTTDIVDRHIISGKEAFLLAKWDGMLASQPDLAEIPNKYSYDKHFAPGGKTESYWRGKAAERGFDIVTQESADETRARLSPTQPNGACDAD